MLISDLEFIKVAVPWTQQPGIAIDIIPSRNGQILTEDIANAITNDTRVLAISSVQWSNGFRCDLDALSRLCHDRNVFLILDAVQHIGANPFDIQKTPVDALACGGHKWLMSPFGCGFLYLNPRFRGRLNPPLAGLSPVAEPDGGWDTYFQTPSIAPARHYDFIDSAALKETGGTANYPGAIALAASVSLINDIGIDTVADHNLCLTDYLIDSLHRESIDIVTPLDRRYRSAIVTFTLGSADDNISLTSFLQQHKVLVGVRYTSGVGGVRVSCHLFNNREDLDRLVSLTAEFIKHPAR